MGKGIDMARQAGAPLHADVLDDLKDQLLIVFLKRLKAAGLSTELSVAEVDDTGNDLVSFRVDQVTRSFHFHLSKKS